MRCPLLIGDDRGKMFEISDDDDNFWESLPMEDITNISNSVCAIPKKQAANLVDHIDQPNKRFRPSSTDHNLDNQDKIDRIPHNLNISVSKPDINNRPGITVDYEETLPRYDLNRNCEVAQHGNSEIVKVNASHPQRAQTDGLPTFMRQPLTSGNFSTLQNSDIVELSSAARRNFQSANNTVPAGGTKSCTAVMNPIQGEKKHQTSKPTKRKFPGPAGLLPKLSPGQKLDNVSIPGLAPKPHTQPRDDAVILSSQSGDDMFTDIPWCSLIEDLQEYKQQVLSDYSVISCLQKASRKLLPDGKVPLMLTVVETVDIQGPDASVTLKDKTGKVLGTMHRDVVKEFASDLHPGVALVLKQVSVVSPSSRSHYLNITHKNIVHLYGHKTTRTPEEITSVRRNLQCVIKAANSQPSLQPRTPTLRRSPPEFNRNVQGNTTPFRTPQFSTPMRNHSHGQSSATPQHTTPVRNSAQGYSVTTNRSSPYSSNSVSSRQFQVQNASISMNSPSVTPSKKFNFRPVNKTTPVTGASPILPRTGLGDRDSPYLHPPGSCMSTFNSDSEVSKQSTSTPAVFRLTASGGVSRRHTGAGVSDKIQTEHAERNPPISVTASSNDADLWQDELGDELISQLSEDMM